MRAIKISFFILFAVGASHAQNIGQWKIYASMKSINRTAVTQSGICAVTNGGAFIFNPADSSFDILTKAEGLSSQALNAVAIDNYNKIWLGSQEGYINIFDPKDNSVKNIGDIFNSNKTQKQINNIFVKGDTVFVSIDFGLSIINATDYSFYDSFLKLGNFSAESKVISAFKSNLIYAVTENGVAIQKSGAQNLSAPESWDNYQFNNDIPAQSASRILDFNGQILLATSSGVLKFSNKTWQLFTLQGTAVNDMTISGSSLYIISPNQLYLYTNGQITKLYENLNVTFNSVSVNNQTIYISTNTGLIELKNNTTRLLYPNGPIGNTFINLSVSPTGTLWVATGKNGQGKGFFSFDGNNWKVFNQANYPSIPSDDYINVYAAPDSSIYLSNWQGGVTIFKNNSFQFFNADNSPLVGIPSNNKFLAIADCKTDSKGNLWIANSATASRKQLSVYTTHKKWYHFNVMGLTELDNLDKMVIDQYDTKWFTVAIAGNLGLYYFNENNTLDNPNDDTQGYIGTNNGLVSNDISSLAIDRRGYLWIGTSAGVNVITDTKNLTITSSLGLAVRNQTVTCIAIDPLDNKWIGTTQGIFVLPPDGGIGSPIIPNYNTSNSPIPNNDIKSIAIDSKSGIVYIGTDYGLAAFQTSSIEPLQSFEELFVYPNPLVLGNGETNSVTIDGLIRNSSIKIFNISGNLISQFKSPGGRIAFWDGKDLNGNFVPSGIYILVAYDEEANNVKTSKIAVIRK